MAISKLAALKEFTTIRAFIHEMLENHLELRNDKFIAHAIVCVSQWDLGFRLIDKMFRRNVKQHMAGLYKEEKFEEVGKIKRTDEANDVLDGWLLSGMKTNSITYWNLVHGYCKEGKMDKAKDMFEEMVKNGFKSDRICYFMLVSHMCKGGEFEEALKVCKQSMEKGWVLNFLTMKMLVVGLAKGATVQEARELSMEKGWVLNFLTMKMLVVGLAKGATVQEARELVGLMKERFLKKAHMRDEDMVSSEVVFSVYLLSMHSLETEEAFSLLDDWDSLTYRSLKLQIVAKERDLNDSLLP
uniref:Uncharacterized protein n=1 Tax=Tanacetum cinerariifolium TaxID=118510 RepID=A0A6L2P284_TANCI|nr:hypothetical protein [Tanacetum cinerariifolium]